MRAGAGRRPTRVMRGGPPGSPTGRRAPGARAHRPQLEDRHRPARLPDAALAEQRRSAVGSRTSSARTASSGHRDDERAPTATTTSERPLAGRHAAPVARVAEVLEPRGVDLRGGHVAERRLVEGGELPQAHRAVQARGREGLEGVGSVGGWQGTRGRSTALAFNHVAEALQGAQPRHLPLGRFATGRRRCVPTRSYADVRRSSRSSLARASAEACDPITAVRRGGVRRPRRNGSTATATPTRTAGSRASGGGSSIGDQRADREKRCRPRDGGEPRQEGSCEREQGGERDEPPSDQRAGQGGARKSSTTASRWWPSVISARTTAIADGAATRSASVAVMGSAEREHASRAVPAPGSRAPWVP